MDFKHTLFKFRIHWKEIKHILYLIAEGIIMLASLGALFTLIYQFGFEQSIEVELQLQRYRIYLLSAFFIGISLRYLIHFKEILHEKLFYLDIGIYFLLFTTLLANIFFKTGFIKPLPYFSFFLDFHLIYALLFFLSITHFLRQIFTLLQSRIKPALLFLLSFIFFILVGWGLLLLPNATVKGIGVIDALFMSATSVCITGLTTVDVATTFTRTGHTILLILLQVGGVGVMTFTSFIALSFMKNSSYSGKLMLKDMLNEERTGGLFRVIVNILAVTFFIEGIGAYLIYREIQGTVSGNFGDELFFSVFHSVAAFCSAGLSTVTGGFTNPLLVDKYRLHVWISILIILGGIGFPIVFNYLKLWRHILANRIRVRLGYQERIIHVPGIINLHTYIVIVTTGVLIVIGFFSYFILEYNHTLADIPLSGKISDSLLLSVTPRTAGITPVDISTLTSPTLVMTIMLMIIGAGPMSTGGGLKVTTVFVAFMTALSFLQEKEHVEIKRKELADTTIKRAFTIIILYFVLLTFVFSLLSITEKEIPLFTILFEAVSALSTVGLSMELTPLLSDMGKLIIVITMLIGRIGILTFFATFWIPSRKRKYLYPKENILM